MLLLFLNCERVLLVHQINSGDSGEIQLWNRSFFCSGFGSVQGAWMPNTGQSVWLSRRELCTCCLANGGAPWSQKIFLRGNEVKKMQPYYFTYAGPCHCTRSPSGEWLGLIIMWCEGGWGLAALHEEVVVHLLLPWKDFRKNIQDPWWKLGHRQRKWINFSFMPRFTPQLLISLSNSTGDKSRRASARMLHCFSWLFCWLVPLWLGCQMIAQIIHLVLHVQN